MNFIIYKWLHKNVLTLTSYPIPQCWLSVCLSRMRMFLAFENEFLHYKKICQFNFLSQPPVTTAFPFGQYSKLITDTSGYATWSPWSVSIQTRHLHLLVEFFSPGFFAAAAGFPMETRRSQDIWRVGVTPRQSPGAQIWLWIHGLGPPQPCPKLPSTRLPLRRDEESEPVSP